MTLYRVTGTLPYRDCKPGEMFEARLDVDAELRALARGNIEILDSSETRLRPGSYALPDGWAQSSSRGPQGPFVLKGAQHG